MGDTRGIGSYVVALLVLVASGLAAVVTAAPAQAAGGFPPQCVQMASGNVVTIEPYSRAVMTDIDVTVGWGFYRPDGAEVTLVNGAPGGYSGQRWVLVEGFRQGDYGGRSVTFDNQATMRFGEPAPDWGSEIRVRPAQQLPDFYGTGDSRWFVEVQRGSYPSTQSTMTVTWSDCDEDDDYSGDKTRDNCVGVSNPDQVDTDGDRAGDACDPDDDNDGVADGSDNCPVTANSDQTDWDGDRLGNACDASPGTAPVTPTPTPAPTGTPTTPTTPTTPAGTQPPTTTTPTCAGACAYPRSIELRHRAKRHRLTGSVTSVAVGCRQAVPVTIWRQRKGNDHKLLVLTTKPSGAFATKAPRRPGRYYATVGSAAEPLCGTDRSPAVRIRRR